MPDQGEPISLAEFLETVPPGTERLIKDALVIVVASYGKKQSDSAYLNASSIKLNCDHVECGGQQKFDVQASGSRTLFGQPELPELSDNSFGGLLARFQCRNCRQSEKTFAVHVAGTAATSEAYESQRRAIDQEVEASEGSKQWRLKPLPALCFKYGERPPFGPAIPSKLLTILRPEHELFIKGRRCESQGLGIAAHAYYRRILENKWRALVKEIVKVAELSGAPTKSIELIAAAGHDKRFSSAVEKIGNALPPSLMVNGHNPLTLLHRALSNGIHNLSDEECLKMAIHIRVVLSALADRISQVLTDKKELDTAIKAILDLNIEPKK